MREFKNAGILGVGVCIPEQVITNDFWDDKEFLNLPAGKPREDCFTGIDERRYFSLETLPSDTEVAAAKMAIANAGVELDEIDLVLNHSMIPDETIPGNASLLQHKLGLKKAAAWNLDTCCSSFVTMFITAANLIACGTFKKILVTTSIHHSKIMDQNHYLAPAAGDGASAVVIGEVSEGRGFIASHCTSNGKYHDAFTVRERLPLSAEQGHKRHWEPAPMRALMTLNFEKAREMGRLSNDYVKEVLFETLKKAEIPASDLNFFFSHQPCHWAHGAWRDQLGLAPEQGFQTFNTRGNLASTSIPTSIYHAVEKNLLKDGDLVMIVSPGAGENHAAALFRWGK